jgi:hypothetical protein
MELSKTAYTKNKPTRFRAVINPPKILAAVTRSISPDISDKMSERIKLLIKGRIMQPIIASKFKCFVNTATALFPTGVTLFLLTAIIKYLFFI